MLRILGTRAPACDGTSRREVLRVGGLSLFGSMTLPRLLQAAARGQHSPTPKARSIILVNLFGGPSHLDMFDMKPDAPAEVRGEFWPIATSVPGLRICEHLPRLARWMHKATLIRSVSHTYNSHNPYAVLTGFTGGDDRENYYTKRTDHPGISAVCQYLGIGPRDLPGSVYLPHSLDTARAFAAPGHTADIWATSATRFSPTATRNSHASSIRTNRFTIPSHRTASHGCLRSSPHPR